MPAFSDSIESSSASSLTQNNNIDSSAKWKANNDYWDPESSISTPTVYDNICFSKHQPQDSDVLKGVDEVAEPDREIEWHYLTFDTELPPLASPPPTDISPPNLRRYESPFLWPNARKSLVTFIAATVTVIAATSAGSYNSASAAMQKKWGVGPVVVELGITLFCVGFAFAPMLLAPFSEINGRRPMFIASGILLTACQVACGGTNSFAGMCLARFFAGVGGSTFSSIVGGVLSDIYVAKERNTPMVLFAASALFGTGVGPMYCGFIAQNTTWRWVFYNQAILSGGAVAVIIALFPETRGSVLLSKKAMALNEYYEKLENEGLYGVKVPVDPAVPEKGTKVVRLRFKTQADDERQGLLSMITVSFCRPFHMLFTEAVVFFFSLWVAFAWAVLYLQFGSIPLVFEAKHHFNLEQSGAVFAAICAGSLIGVVASLVQDHFFVKYFPEQASAPEGRLYFSCIASFLLPIGLFWFGWTSYSSIPWIVPSLGIACATIGIFSIYVAVFNFLADAYHRYASSALAAQSFCRNLCGGIFPLVTRALFNNLGTPAASSLLGGIGCALSIVPWVLVFYGPQIRAKSKIASQIMSLPEV